MKHFNSFSNSQVLTVDVASFLPLWQAPQPLLLHLDSDFGRPLNVGLTFSRAPLGRSRNTHVLTHRKFVLTCSNSVQGDVDTIPVVPEEKRMLVTSEASATCA